MSINEFAEEREVNKIKEFGSSHNMMAEICCIKVRATKNHKDITVVSVQTLSHLGLSRLSCCTVKNQRKYRCQKTILFQIN